ncbi:MAG: 3-phosphoshikimate 1-carboxyvinyltransferase [Clostridia bacterium]|nr:3-phosphoshikimate 1-carboxyvinyltransferase [Clostridia bacterium]
MRVIITPGKAAGQITAPPSKSMAHRLLICAAMCDGVSTVRGISSCEDVSATLDCMAALGIKAEVTDDCVTVYGKNARNVSPTAPLFCRESGSTLRFFIPIAMLCSKNVTFTGAKSLMSRPMDVYEKLSRELGLGFLSDGESITVKGPLKSGSFTVAGNVSSQFISGLLFALPNLKCDSRIKITPPIESRPYIDMTIEALGLFGVRAFWEDERTIFVPGGQSYQPSEVEVEGDYSGSAFPDALNLFGSDVKISGLNPDSIQGDSAYRRFYAQLDRGTPTIHIGNCPDLGPILFAVAAARNGGIFSGTKRLRIKESDRAAAMAEELAKFGASVTVHEDNVVIYPASFHAPSEPLCGHNDHRIVMATAILATLTGGEILGAEAVKKSYPTFFDDLKALGIGVTQYED